MVDQIEQILMAIPNPTPETLRSAIERIYYVDWVNIEENDYVYCVRWGEKRVLDGGGRVIIHKGV